MRKQCPQLVFFKLNTIESPSFIHMPLLSRKGPRPLSTTMFFSKNIYIRLFDFFNSNVQTFGNI